jgi:hypothetical protein
VDDRQPTARSLPGLTKAGMATIAFGFLFDLSEHSFAPPTAGSFTAGEHAAHLVVLIGMVLALAGIVADGLRQSGRIDREERSTRGAVR